MWATVLPTVMLLNSNFFSAHYPIGFQELEIKGRKSLNVESFKHTLKKCMGTCVVSELVMLSLWLGWYPWQLLFAQREKFSFESHMAVESLGFVLPGTEMMDLLPWSGRVKAPGSGHDDDYCPIPLTFWL